MLKRAFPKNKKGVAGPPSSGWCAAGVVVSISIVYYGLFKLPKGVK